MRQEGCVAIPISTPKHKGRKANSSRKLIVPFASGLPPFVSVSLKQNEREKPSKFSKLKTHGLLKFGKH